MPLRAPSLFKAEQAFMSGFRSAKTEFPVSILNGPLDGVVHHQVIGPQVLEGHIRRPELVNNLFAKMKVHRPADNLFLMSC